MKNFWKASIRVLMMIATVPGAEAVELPDPCSLPESPPDWLTSEDRRALYRIANREAAACASVDPRFFGTMVEHRNRILRGRLGNGQKLSCAQPLSLSPQECTRLKRRIFGIDHLRRRYLKESINNLKLGIHGGFQSIPEEFVLSEVSLVFNSLNRRPGINLKKIEKYKHAFACARETWNDHKGRLKVNDAIKDCKSVREPANEEETAEIKVDLDSISEGPDTDPEDQE